MGGYLGVDKVVGVVLQDVVVRVGGVGVDEEDDINICNKGILNVIMIKCDYLFERCI